MFSRSFADLRALRAFVVSYPLPIFVYYAFFAAIPPISIEHQNAAPQDSPMF